MNVNRWIVAAGLLGLGLIVFFAPRASATDYWRNDYSNNEYWGNSYLGTHGGWRVTEYYRDPRRHQNRGFRDHGPVFESREDCRHLIEFVKPDDSGSRLVCHWTGGVR